MEKNKKGFVYILTNKSFREDWVKIGKSSRPVDIRSKELDNTAIPLPFDIYATVETAKYNEIEAELHKILTNLGDMRIRPNREFFNIKPEKAFSYLCDLAGLTDDAVINAPDEVQEKTEKKSPIFKGKYHVEGTGVFYFKNDVVDARMEVANGNRYILKEGSTIDPSLYSNIDPIKAKRKEYKDKLSEDGKVVLEDIEFTSPSTAADFVRGGSCNGKYYWRSSDNKPLNDFIIYDK